MLTDLHNVLTAAEQVSGVRYEELPPAEAQAGYILEMDRAAAWKGFTDLPTACRRQGDPVRALDASALRASTT
nr:hypothetical protein KitaXyl93_05880 [Kitasatospora sp. Xyl93]